MKVGRTYADVLECACGRRNDCSTHLDGRPGRPAEGAFAICAECAATYVLTGGAWAPVRLEDLAPADRAELARCVLAVRLARSITLAQTRDRN